MFKPYISSHFSVLRSRYDFVRELAAGLDEQTFRLFAHILRSTLVNLQRHVGERFSEIPWAVVEQKIGRRASWRELLRRDLIEVVPHIPGVKARGYRVRDWVLDRWFDISRQLSYDDHLNAPIVNLMTGQPSVREPKTKKTRQGDSNRNPLPRNVREALEEVGRNGSYFNRRGVENWLQEERGEVERLRRKMDIVRLTEGEDSEAYEKAEKEYKRRKRRWEGADLLYTRILHRKSTHQVTGDIYWYQPAYEIAENGGRAVQKSGFQNAPGEMKAAAYGGIEGLRNYDLEAAHPNALRQLLQEAGINSDWLDKLLATREGGRGYKEVYGEQVGLDGETWKTVFIAVLYGADLPVKASKPVKLPGGKRQSRVRVALWEAAEGDLGKMQVLINRLREQLAPLIETRDRWYDWLLDEYVPRQKRRTVRNGREYIVNAVGTLKYLDELPVQRRYRANKIAALLLMGMESRYINALVTLGPQYGYKVIALEYDGVVTIGEIPEEAKQRALTLSDFRYARLVEKPFAADQTATNFDTDDLWEEAA